MSHFNSLGGGHAGRGSGSPSHHCPVHGMIPNSGGSGAVGAVAGQRAQSSSPSQDGQHKSAPQKVEVNDQVDPCTVHLLFVTRENKSTSENFTSLRLSIPEWLHIMKSSKSYQSLKDKLKLCNILLLEQQATGEKIHLQVNVDSDPSLTQKESKEKLIESYFWETTKELLTMFYKVPSEMHEKAKARLQQSDACRSNLGTVYFSSRIGVFVFVTHKDNGKAVFDEFNKILLSLSQNIDSDFGTDGSNESPSVFEGKESDLQKSLVKETAMTIGEHVYRANLENTIQLTHFRNEFLKASEHARRYLLSELSKVAIECQFDHENSSIIFTADSPESLKKAVMLNILVREQTIPLKGSNALHLYNLDEICHMLEEKCACEKGELMVFPVPKQEELILVGIDDAMTKAEDFMHEIETQFSEVDIPVPEQTSITRQKITDLESEAKIFTEGPIRVKKNRQPPYGVKVIGKTSAIEEFKKKLMTDDSFYPPPLTFIIDDAPLALLKSKTSAGVFLRQKAEKHGISVSVDIEKKDYIIRASEFDAKKFLSEWYKSKTVAVSRGLSGKTEEDVRSCLSDFVDLEKVLVSMENQKLTLTATVDEYSKAEKCIEDLRLGRMISHDSSSSRSAGDASGDAPGVGLVTQSHTPEEVGTSQEVKMVVGQDAAQISFVEDAGNEGNTSLKEKDDSSSLDLTSYEFTFMQKEKELMEHVEKLLSDRHHAMIKDTDARGGNLRITIEKLCRSSENDLKTSDWKQQICDIFLKAKSRILQSKLKIKEEYFKTVQDQILTESHGVKDAIFFQLPEESSVVVVCSQKISKSVMRTIQERWSKFLAKEQIIAKQFVQPLQPEFSDAREPPIGADREAGGGSLEANTFVTLALVMDQADYADYLYDQAWSGEHAQFVSKTPVDILAGKKMILLQGQKTNVDDVVKQANALLTVENKHRNPVIVRDIAHIRPYHASLTMNEGHRCLLLKSHKIQHHILKELLTRNIVCCLDTDGRQLRIWYKSSENPDTAVEVVTKSIQHRIISLKSYGNTPFSSVKDALETDDTLVQVTQTDDDVWICFFVAIKDNINDRLSQLEKEFLVVKNTVSLAKDDYGYYTNFCMEDLKALRKDHGVSIVLRQTDSDRYELVVKGTKQKANAVADVFKKHLKLQRKDMPVEEGHLEVLNTTEGLSFLKSLEMKNRCILSLVDSSEATLEASSQDGPCEVYRHDQNSAVGERIVSVVTGKLENWPADVMAVPVWDVSDLTEMMSSLKEFEADVDMKDAERKMRRLNFDRGNMTCFFDTKLRGEPIALACVLLPNDWGNAKNKERERTITAIAQLLAEVYKNGLQTILFNIDDIFAHLTEKGIKSILQSLKEVFCSKEKLSVKVILFAEEVEFANKTKENLKVAFGEDPYRYKEPQLILDELANVKADILVNTTSTNLELANGAVSLSLLNKAGQSIQEECKKRYPDGVQFGKMVETDSGAIKDVKAIYHGALPLNDKSANREYIKKMLMTFMTTCLEKASESGHKSIAFPALGAGKLEYPHAVVAEVMFRCFEEFCGRYPRSSLRDVIFVLYPKDRQIIQVFYAEQVARMFRPCSQSRTDRPNDGRFWIHDTLLQIIQCDTEDFRLKNDEVINMIDSSEIGEFVRQLGLNHEEELRVKHELGTEKFARICHHSRYTSPMVVWVYKREKLYDAWKKIFSSIKKEKVKIFMPRNAQEMSKSLVKYLKDKKKNEVYLVSVFVLTLEEFHKLSSQFKAEKSGSSSWLSWLWPFGQSDGEEWTSNKRLEVGGIRITAKSKEALEDACEDIVKYLLKKCTSVSQSTRNNHSSQDDFEHINHDEASERAVTQDFQSARREDKTCVILPSARLKKEEIEESLMKEEIQGVVFPHPSSEKESIIVVSEKDFQPTMELFSTQAPTVLPSEMTLHCTLPVKKKYKGYAKEEQFKLETGLTIHESNGETSVAGPFIQIFAAVKYFGQKRDEKWSLPLLSANPVASSRDQENQGTARSSSKSLILEAGQYAAAKVFIEEKILTEVCFSKQLEDKRGVCLKFNDTPAADKIMKRIVAFNSESVDVQVSVDAEKEKLLKDVMDEHKKIFVQLSDDKKKAVIISEDWAEMSAAKKKIQLILGQVKASSRAKRQFAASSTPTPVASSGPQTSMKHTESRQTIHQQVSDQNSFRVGDLTVLVYKADLTTLKVDAIVNAANKNLSHGSGVARAIAKAAGSVLDDESRNYVHNNGTIPVTGVAPTTSGNMPCRRVLHAVGPQWIDYKDKEKCHHDLCKTILRCLIEANNMGAVSVAIPAISSGIYGVPKDICCDAYVRGTKLFGDTAKPNGSLREVHFVDVSDKMVTLISDAFHDYSNEHIVATEKESSFMKQYMKRYAEGNEKQNQMKQSSEKSSQVFSSHFQNPKITAGDQVQMKYEYSLKKTGVIKLYTGDLVKVRTGALVSWENIQLAPASRASQALRDATGHIKVPRDPKKALDFLEVLSSHSGNLTDVKRIIHAIVPTDSMTTEELKEVLTRILQAAQFASLSVAMTVITSQKVDLKEFGIRLCHVLSEYLKLNESIPEVHIVDKNPAAITQIRSVFDDHLTPEETVETMEVDVPGAVGGEQGEECVICTDVMKDVKTLHKCGHKFCKKCIDQSFQYKPVCPVCGAIYGAVKGNMPHGTMNVKTDFRNLPGYRHCGTYVITYCIRDGVQTDEHPSPNKPFKGVYREAYLPKTKEGETVLRLLKIAFDRRLTFTVGRSVTTGKEDAVTWNDIHHKTSTVFGGDFGYPDEGYFERVKGELAAKGVTEADIDWTQPLKTWP